MNKKILEQVVLGEAVLIKPYTLPYKSNVAVTKRQLALIARLGSTGPVKVKKYKNISRVNRHKHKKKSG